MDPRGQKTEAWHKTVLNSARLGHLQARAIDGVATHSRHPV